MLVSKGRCRDFSHGPVAKNLPVNAGDMNEFSPWAGKVPHVLGQLSLRATTIEALAPLIPCSAIREATTVRNPSTATGE